MKEHRVSVTRAEAYFRLLAVKAKSYPYAPSLSERTFMATTILCSDGMRRKSRSTCKRARTPTNHTSSARALGNTQSRRPHARTPARTTNVRGTHRAHPAQAPRAHIAHTRALARPRLTRRTRARRSSLRPGASLRARAARDVDTMSASNLPEASRGQAMREREREAVRRTPLAQPRERGPNRRHESLTQLVALCRPAGRLLGPAKSAKEAERSEKSASGSPEQASHWHNHHHSLWSRKNSEG